MCECKNIEMGIIKIIFKMWIKWLLCVNFSCTFFWSDSKKYDIVTRNKYYNLTNYVNITLI